MARFYLKEGQPMKRTGDDISPFLLLCGVLAPVMMLVIIIVVGKITPDYNPVSDTISQMGIPGQPYAMVLHGGYIFYGLLMGTAAYGLYRSLNFTRQAKGLAVLIGIHAAGIMLLAVFPDSRDSPLKHIIHDVISTISYLPLIISVLIARGIARREKALKVVGILGLAVIAINLPMPVINMVEPFKQVSGLIQRLLSASSFSWLTLVFLLLYRKRNRLYRKYNSGQGCPAPDQPQSRKYPTKQSGSRVRNVLQNNQTFPILKPCPLHHNNANCRGKLIFRAERDKNTKRRKNERGISQ
jgi:hypothetical membrane protein